VLTPTEVNTIKTEVQEEIYRELTEYPGITPAMRRWAARWDFSAAMDTLGLRDIENRRRCENELILICVNHDLMLRAEEQETPGRKARALQLAPRWQKKRTQEQKLFWRIARNIDKRLAEELAQQAAMDKQLSEQAVRLALRRLALRLWEKRPWLPRSLEHEAVRALGRIPQSRDDFALLRKQMMRQARRGGYKSWALRNTIHALQACATTRNKKLIWDEGCHAPPKLLRFLVQVLRAAKIQHPNPETRYSKFVALMLRPKKQTERQTERPPKQRPSKAERRLAGALI
jgi:hypothetical protein